MREKFQGRRSTEELYFRCNFNIHPDVNITYQVKWHIDGQLVFTSPPVTVEYLNQTFLTEENGLILNRKVSVFLQTKSDTLKISIINMLYVLFEISSTF